VTAVEGDGGGWFREQIRERKDPVERDSRRAAVARRLFGTPAEDVEADPEPGPAAA